MDTERILEYLKKCVRSLKSYLYDWITLKKKASVIPLVALVIFGYFSYYSQDLMKYYSPAFEKEIQSTAEKIVSNSSTNEDAVMKIIQWENKNVKNIYGKAYCPNNLCFTIESPFICVRIIEHNNPSWIFFNKCGACEEFSLLFAELANSVNITTRSIHNHGEDHNWDEVLINNSWIIVDPSMLSDKFNIEPSYYEKNRSLNMSYVYALDSKGNKIDVTNRYTNTGELIVSAMNNDTPLENVTIFIGSNSYIPNLFTGAECVTNSSGACYFTLGGASYTILALKDGVLKYSDSKTIFLEENHTLEVKIYPNKIDLLRSIPDYLQLLSILLILWVFIGAINWEINCLPKIRK